MAQSPFARQAVHPAVVSAQAAFGQHRPREANQLPLAKREVAAALAHRSFKALGQRREHVEAIEAAHRFDHLLVAVRKRFHRQTGGR